MRDKRDRHEAREEHDRDRAHDHESALRVLDLGATEGLHAVRDRLDAREGGASAREGAQEQQHEGRLAEVVHLHVELRALGDGRIAEGCAHKGRHDHDGDARDEEVGREGEGLARLAHAAQVDRREQDDEPHRELDAPRVERRERRDDVVHARGDRHRDGHDVVHEQGGRDDEPRLLAEVLRRDLVVAAARGIGLDELAVGEHDDREQHDDGECDPGPVRDEAEAAAEQDEDELLRRIRDRRERVAREDRQRQMLGEQLPFELLGRQRIADEPVLGRSRRVV